MLRYVDQQIDFFGELVTIRRFASQALGVNGGDAWTLIDKASDSQFNQFVGSVVEEGKQKSLRGARIGDKITDAGGDIAKTLGYIEKDGKVIWLEEGVAEGKPTDFGMKHIWDKHHPLGASIGGSTGSKFPEYFTREDITDVIFDVIESGEKLPSNPNHPGKYAMEKVINFGNGKTEKVVVALEDSGKVLTAYPVKSVI